MFAPGWLRRAPDHYNNLASGLVLLEEVSQLA